MNLLLIFCMQRSLDLVLTIMRMLINAYKGKIRTDELKCNH